VPDEIKEQGDPTDVGGQAVLPDLFYLRTMIVNLCLVGDPQKPEAGWVLVDAGIGGMADRIIAAAEARYGEGTRPNGIILTHGHFDHVGSLEPLADHWNVPIYAHEQELPYLTGKADYPPGDPTVGGGLMAELAPLYPNKGIDLGMRVRALPKDGSIPGMPGWRWIPTPGHTPGHISLFREQDRALIAGDAFITVRQESALAVITQEKEIHGPPQYFTPDWRAAKESVARLAALQPSVAVTGHGVPMRGEELSRGLTMLVERFDEIAVPEEGRYIY